MKNILLFIFGVVFGSVTAFASSPDLVKEVQRSHDRIQSMWEQRHKGQMEDKKRFERIEKYISMNSAELDYERETSYKPLIRNTKSEQDTELADLVKISVSEYLSESGRSPSCYIGETETTLSTIVQRKIIQEGGYENGSAGRRTNNPGSLRGGPFFSDIKSYTNNDNTKSWIVYHSMKDGIKDLAYVIDQNYDCKVTIGSIFAYVYGPRAERTQQRTSHVQSIFRNFYSIK